MIIKTASNISSEYLNLGYKNLYQIKGESKWIAVESLSNYIDEKIILVKSRTSHTEIQKRIIINALESIKRACLENNSVKEK